MNKQSSNYNIVLVILVALAMLLTACSTEGLAAESSPEDVASAAPVVVEMDLNYYKGSGHFSGDDFYDEAANISPAVATFSGSMTFSGDDAYDSAVSVPEPAVSLSGTGSFSGDDAYDPAAGE